MPTWSSTGVEVSARPSDAIALALRTGTRIVGADEVLEEAGIAVADEQEDEVEKFREFLDQISPEDFEHPQPEVESYKFSLRSTGVATRGGNPPVVVDGEGPAPYLHK